MRRARAALADAAVSAGDGVAVAVPRPGAASDVATDAHTDADASEGGAALDILTCGRAKATAERRLSSAPAQSGVRRRRWCATRSGATRTATHRCSVRPRHIGGSTGSAPRPRSQSRAAHRICDRCKAVAQERDHPQ